MKTKLQLATSGEDPSRPMPPPSPTKATYSENVLLRIDGDEAEQEIAPPKSATLSSKTLFSIRVTALPIAEAQWMPPPDPVMTELCDMVLPAIRGKDPE